MTACGDHVSSSMSLFFFKAIQSNISSKYINEITEDERTYCCKYHIYVFFHLFIVRTRGHIQIKFSNQCISKAYILQDFILKLFIVAAVSFYFYECWGKNYSKMWPEIFTNYCYYPFSDFSFRDSHEEETAQSLKKC